MIAFGDYMLVSDRHDKPIALYKKQTSFNCSTHCKTRFCTGERDMHRYTVVATNMSPHHKLGIGKTIDVCHSMLIDGSMCYKFKDMVAPLQREDVSHLLLTMKHVLKETEKLKRGRKKKTESGTSTC